MNENILTIQCLLQNYSLNLSEKIIKKYISNIQDAQELFPQSAQEALIIKLLNDWKNQKNKKIITATSEVCLVNGKHCLSSFGILCPDWPGLSNACVGVLNEMGWNIYFVKGFSIIYRKQRLGIIIIGIETDKEEIYQKILSQTETILSKLHQAAVGTGAKAYLLSEEIRKLEIYSQVIAQIEQIYKGDDLEQIIGLNGEAVKFFAARSRDYIQNRKIEDIARQIILNYNFIKTVHKTGKTIQLDITNFTTMTEGTFTGVTITGPVRLLHLEDCLKTIELITPNFQLKHNREFTTNTGISIYRIEFVDHLNFSLGDLEQERLRKAFTTMVLNKRRDRAQWIESIGGFEQYARAIIPLLVREAQNTDKTQVYQSVGHSTDLFIDYKVIVVVPNSTETGKKLLNKTVKNIESVPGMHILSVKPPRAYGNTEVFIIDLRASLAVIENIELIYQIIRENIKNALGEFRDFDEGMRTIDTEKLKSIRRIIEGIDKRLIRELYYSIEDFFRLSSSTDEIIAHIKIILDMLKMIEDSDENIHIISRHTGIYSKTGILIPSANLLCIAYPHQLNLLQNILEILESYEVTLSRLERAGCDILLCRTTQRGKALPEDIIVQLSKQIQQLITST
jgi:hypothetical protein